MALLIPFDPGDMDPKVVSALDDIIVALQTWAGRVDGIGKWITIPHAANLYTTNDSTNTWDVAASARLKYTRIVDTVIVDFDVANSLTTSDTQELRIRLQGLKAKETEAPQPVFFENGSGVVVAQAIVTHNLSDSESEFAVIRIGRMDAAAMTGVKDVYGKVIFEALPEQVS